MSADPVIDGAYPGSADPRACAWGCNAAGLWPVVDPRRGPAPETAYLCADCRGRGLPPLPEVKPRFRRDGRGRLVPLTAGRPTPADERVAGSLDGARFRQVLPPLAHERPEWLRDLDDHEDDHEDEDVPEPVGTEEHHLEDEMGNKKLTTEERRQRLREALHEAGKAGLGATDLKVLNLRMGASKSGHLRDVRALLADGSMTYKGEKSGRRYFASPKSAPAPARVVDHPPSAGAKNHACTYPDLNVERAPVADAYAAVLADLQSRLTTAQDAKARAVEAVRAAEEDRARAYTLAEEIEASIRLLRKVS